MLDLTKLNFPPELIGARSDTEQSKKSYPLPWYRSTPARTLSAMGPIESGDR